MMHKLVRLQPAQGRHVHRAIAANAAQVIAQQVHNHDVFRAVLGARQEFAHQPCILGRIRNARPRPLDRPGFHLALLDANKALGRGAGNHKVTQVLVSRKGRRVTSAQPEIKRERRQLRGINKALGNVDLEAIAGMNVSDGPLHSPQVFRAAEVAR